MAGIEQIKPIKIKEKSTAKDIWLADILDDYLTGIMSAPRTGVFHPSVISITCDRYVWLCYHGRMVDQPLSAKLARIFQNGNFLEDRVGHWLTELNILLDREVSVKQEIPPISGRIDFLINHYKYGTHPIELKSINTAGFGKLQKPKVEHQIQIQMYLNMGGYDVGTVLYENKNDQNIKAFLVEKDPIQWDEILNRCFRIQEMLMPPEKCSGATWCNCRKVENY